jgi:hypothetical protein
VSLSESARAKSAQRPRTGRQLDSIGVIEGSAIEHIEARSDARRVDDHNPLLLNDEHAWPRRIGQHTASRAKYSTALNRSQLLVDSQYY